MPDLLSIAEELLGRLKAGDPQAIGLVAGIAAIVLGVVILIVVFCLRKRKGRKAGTESQAGVTERPSPAGAYRSNAPVEIANLQGLGRRSEQQDAFGVSPLAAWKKQGILAVLCDGMGGMAEGGVIAREAVQTLMSVFPWKNDSVFTDVIDDLTGSIYRQFLGQGGTTLVAARLIVDELSFWCVGDSDLFLFRNGRLYAMNERQEFRNFLLRRALDGALSVEEAYSDEQASALDQYIGKERVTTERTLHPFRMRPDDRLLLCSDGISDVLTLVQIRDAMALDLPEQTCARLEELVLAAANPIQDNFTAIVIKYNGDTTTRSVREEENK